MSAGMSTMTTFAPCILIPLYNHGSTIYRTVAQLQAYALPIIIVDDGSDAATQAALQNVLQDFTQVQAVRLAHNSGKGAAVMRGFREAVAAGYSHALQVDADGQHALPDIPRFLAAARAYPQALICGQPIYDASAPAGRRYGRWITHFWVWVETLSLAIGDSLCGFRFYPLAPVLQLIERTAIQARMSFDTDIAVRLYWQGMPVMNLETRVIYPEGGVSHFSLLRDNLRISKTHARLVCGMVLRLPRLLWRKVCGPSQHLRAVA